MASGGRRHPGVDARRVTHRLRVGAQLAEWADEVLERRSTGRRRGGALHAAGLPGNAVARREARGLSHEWLVGRRAAQLSRRAEPPDLDHGPGDARGAIAALDRLEGHRPRLDRRRRLLPVRPGRSAQRLVVRHAKPGAGAVDEVHRLRREGARRRRRHGGIRAGGVPAHARPTHQAAPAPRHHRARRLPVARPAVERRRQPDHQHRPLAHREARGGGGAGRDLHHPRREG